MMWKKPWKVKEGFLIGGGLIIVGLILELSANPVNWSVFKWPVNIVAITIFLIAVAVTAAFASKVYLFRYLCTYGAAIPALCYAVVLTIIMGLIRQDANGTWFDNMLSFWPFVIIYSYVAFILGRVVLKQVSLLPRKLTSFLFHLGLLVVLLCATLGNPDMKRLKLIATTDIPEWRALDDNYMIVELPMRIELKQFIYETYDDGSPKRYASDIEVVSKSGNTYTATVDVNHPAKVEGWTIYQYGYDTEQGAQSNMSILELVRDPWLPYVYTGIFLMLAAAVLLLFKRQNTLL